MITDTFTSLGNNTRLQIVERLLRDGETAVGDLKIDQNLSAPALSRHLKVLREAGVIDQRVDAQRRMYKVRPEAIRAIAEWSLSYEQFWSSSLNRLAMALDNEVPKQ